MKNILNKMLFITSEIKEIQMSGKNIRDGYQYYTEKDIVETVKPLLEKMKVYLDTSVESIKEAGTKTIARITYRFIDLDSMEYLEGTWEGSTNSLDKTGNVVQKAITGAIKCMIMKKFGITSNEEPESEKKVFDDNSNEFNVLAKEKLLKNDKK